jgi:hypothetical protein
MVNRSFSGVAILLGAAQLLFTGNPFARLTLIPIGASILGGALVFLLVELFALRIAA